MVFAKTMNNNTTVRGYGRPHQKLRAQLLPSAYGQPCPRCGRPMLQGQELHLDHTDDRTGYLGFSHANCNRRAGARKARAKQIRLVQALQALGNRCPICGEPITPGRIYCSRRCGWIAHKDDPPKPKAQPKAKAKAGPKPARSCAMCGQPLPKGRQRHCSDRCMSEHNARTNRERYRTEQGLLNTWDRPVKTASRW